MRCLNTPRRQNHDGARPRIRADVPQVRFRETGGHANGRLPVLLQLLELRHRAAAQRRRLLRLLLVRIGEMPAGSGAAFLLQLALPK